KLQPDGTPVIVSDPAIHVIKPGNNNPFGGTKGALTCDLGMPIDCDPAITNAADPMFCDASKVHPDGCKPLTKYDNHWAIDAEAYKEIPDYLWEVVIRYNLGTPDQLGVYPN